MSGHLEGEGGEAFASSRQAVEGLLSWLEGAEAAELDHAGLECHLEVQGREVLRLMFQDHLDLRAEREVRLGEVTDAGGLSRGAVEAGHQRDLASVFGPVVVSRLAYRRRGQPNLHPADGALNLPPSATRTAFAVWRPARRPEAPSTTP